MNENIIWFASVFSMIGVWLEYISFLKTGRSEFLNSKLFLPLFWAGIIQWFLFGIKFQYLAIISTCFLQLIPLSHLLFLYGRKRMNL